jgi:hypothetical protein
MFLFYFYFENLFFFVRKARALPLWARIVIIGTVGALVAGGAIGAGVYFATHGQYFHFNRDTHFFQISYFTLYLGRLII